MNSTEASLTVRQGVIIASRVLCALFLLEALVNISYFPSYIAGAMHASRGLSVLGPGDNYLLNVYVRDIAIGAIRLVLELFFAASFYRHGPAIAKFLLGDELAPSDPPADI